MKKNLPVLLFLFIISTLQAQNTMYVLGKGEYQLSELKNHKFMRLQNRGDSTKVGCLDFIISQPDAQITLSKNGKKIQIWEGSKLLDGLQVGEYELFITKDLYSPVTKKFIIEADKTKIENITLLRVDKSDVLDEEYMKDLNRYSYVVDNIANYPHGIDALLKFISDNLTYPEQAKKAAIQGKVLVQYEVETNGEVTNVKILRGIGFGCDEEAVRIVKLMPNWYPAKYEGKYFKMSMAMPIVFKLP
ncbi:MAG: energy transducer TonB [bacterium]